MLGTNLNDIFDNIVTQDSHYRGSARKNSPLQHLEQRLSNFYYEEVNVKCSYHSQLHYRSAEFSKIIHVTFPEEAFIIDEGEEGLDKKKLDLLTGIPCYKYQYRDVLPTTGGTEGICVDKISKCDYGSDRDENSPIQDILKASEELQKFIFEYRGINTIQPTLIQINKFTEEKNSKVQEHFISELKKMFPDAERKPVPGQNLSQSIYIKSKSLLIEMKYKQFLAGRDKEKTHQDYQKLVEGLHDPKLFQDEFNTPEEWLEEQEFRNIIARETDLRYNNWIKIMINFGCQDIPNIRFVMDASLRNDILSAAEEAVNNEKEFKKIFYRKIYQQHSVCLPHDVGGSLKFKSTMSISPENNDSYPDILKVIDIDNNALTSFVILQQKDYKVKISQSLTEYRRFHGIPLVRLTFDFETGIFYENHIPLCIKTEFPNSSSDFKLQLQENFND